VTRTRLVATSDCETCRDGWITQPVNTASSLAYVVAGTVTLGRAERGPARTRRGGRAVGWSLVAVGLGSVAYHGPGGVLGRWLHDASLLAMAGVVVATDLAEARGSSPAPAALATTCVAAGALAHPRTSAVAQAVAGGAAAAFEAHRHASLRGSAAAADRARASSAAILGAAGVVLHVQGRTGQPWCRPDSLLQPHAAWHALSAAALAARARPLGT
jgi:hypothetical protein